eukprot:scaffold87511_cov17-Tisochrysis_lutea.AAC.1
MPVGYLQRLPCFCVRALHAQRGQPTWQKPPSTMLPAPVHAHGCSRWQWMRWGVCPRTSRGRPPATPALQPCTHRQTQGTGRTTRPTTCLLPDRCFFPKQTVRDESVLSVVHLLAHNLSMVSSSLLELKRLNVTCCLIQCDLMRLSITATSECTPFSHRAMGQVQLKHAGGRSLQSRVWASTGIWRAAQVQSTKNATLTYHAGH